MCLLEGQKNHCEIMNFKALVVITTNLSFNFNFRLNFGEDDEGQEVHLICTHCRVSLCFFESNHFALRKKLNWLAQV